MELVKIQAYKYQELDDKAKENYIHTMWDMPFYYEMDKNPFDSEYESIDGKMIHCWDYFGDWQLSEQIDFCDCNEYLFDKYGNMIHHLIEQGE